MCDPGSLEVRRVCLRNLTHDVVLFGVLLLIGCSLSFSLTTTTTTVQCRTPLAEGARRCFAVRGAFTLESSTSDDLAWAVEPTLDTVRSVMDQKQLQDVHPGVMDVTFLERIDSGDFQPPDATDNNSTANGGDRDVGSFESEGLDAWYWVLISPLVVAVLGYTVLMSVRRRRRAASSSSSVAAQDPAEVTMTGVPPPHSVYHDDPQQQQVSSRFAKLATEAVAQAQPKNRDEVDQPLDVTTEAVRYEDQSDVTPVSRVPDVDSMMSTEVMGNRGPGASSGSSFDQLFEDDSESTDTQSGAFPGIV